MSLTQIVLHIDAIGADKKLLQYYAFTVLKKVNFWMSVNK